MRSNLHGYYIIWSWVAGAWAIYLILLPLLSPLFAEVAPALWKCPFQQLSGRPCPFCGLTRGFANLMRGDISGALHHNALAPWLFSMLILEIGWRSLILWRLKNWRVSPRVVIPDIGLHFLIGVFVALLSR